MWKWVFGASSIKLFWLKGKNNQPKTPGQQASKKASKNDLTVTPPGILRGLEDNV